MYRRSGAPRGDGSARWSASTLSGAIARCRVSSVRQSRSASLSTAPVGGVHADPERAEALGELRASLGRRAEEGVAPALLGEEPGDVGAEAVGPREHRGDLPQRRGVAGGEELAPPHVEVDGRLRGLAARRAAGLGEHLVEEGAARGRGPVVERAGAGRERLVGPEGGREEGHLHRALVGRTLRGVVGGDVPERVEQPVGGAVAVVARHHVFEFVEVHDDALSGSGGGRYHGGAGAYGRSPHAARRTLGAPPPSPARTHGNADAERPRAHRAGEGARSRGVRRPAYRGPWWSSPT
jgi:hypothetical protein